MSSWQAALDDVDRMNQARPAVAWRSGKRKATTQGGSYKRSRVTPRAGYSTVPRTTGVYGRGEMKYFDTEGTNLTVPASSNWAGTEVQPNVGTPNTFVCPTVGSAINQRIGRDITLMKLKIRGLIRVVPQQAVSTLDEACIVRLILVQDMQTNAAQVQGEQVMQPSTTADPSNCINTYQNLANFGRFKVFKDERIPLIQPEAVYEATSADQSGYNVPFEYTIQFPVGLKIRFNATNGGTIADIVDNSFTLLATCNNINLAPKLYYSARACYKE